MVVDVDPLVDENVELPEGTSVVQKEPSEKALREAHFERMEEPLEPIIDDQSEENSEWRSPIEIVFFRYGT